MDKQLQTVLIVALTFGLFVFVMGIVIVVWIIQAKREKERTQQIQNLAGFLGLTFAATAPLEWFPNVNNFALFTQGHSKKIGNVLYGTIEGIKAAFFDYQYVTGSGKSRHVHNQSVVYLEPKDLNLPSFSLRPENTLHKIISALGYQDIDFGNRPEFSRQYLLRGADEQSIRQTFNDRCLSFYEANLGASTDGGGNQLFVFRPNQRVSPLEVQLFINWAVEVKNVFANRW